VRRWGRRRRRRKTNWVVGANFGEDVDNAAVVLTALGVVSTAFTVELTNEDDLQSAGGEGAKVVRVVGSLHFGNMGRPVTDAPGFIRCALFTMQRGQVAASLNSKAPDLFTVAGQAQENILWMDQCWVGSGSLEVVPEVSTNLGIVASKLYIDAGAQRRLENDLSLAFTIQGCPATGGAPAAPTGLEVSGYLRVLLMHAL